MVHSAPPARDPSPTPDEEDVDALLESLENEDDSAYRAQRLEQLNAEFAAAKTNRTEATRVVEDGGSGGAYPTLSSDQALLDVTTETKRCVVHFAHPDFARCATMDEHLRPLALAHHDVRFARVDVRNTPFVVEKLKIRVLPCVIGFKDGIAVERVLGFEGLAAGGRDGTDAISTATLEKRLLYKGILMQARLKEEEGDDASDVSDADADSDDAGKGRRALRRGNARLNRGGDDDDDDWD
ncbi:thioredoxin-like protein [Aspergillus ambiguus]|uniref:thioredoxin domain-containing protein n=1 Tax=Aspergillus ambiguus TaxID=176160 RepID=UPI003CCCF3A0